MISGCYTSLTFAMDVNAVFAYPNHAMPENLIDLEELAVRLNKNRTHLASCIRADPNFPRYNTNTNPNAKRKRYMFNWEEVLAYINDTGKDKKEAAPGPTKPAPTVQAEGVDDLVRVKTE
jgi:hypothetical protein